MKIGKNVVVTSAHIGGYFTRGLFGVITSGSGAMMFVCGRRGAEIDGNSTVSFAVTVVRFDETLAAATVLLRHSSSELWVDSFESVRRGGQGRTASLPFERLRSPSCH